MKILITAIGKRVQLIKYLKKNCTIVGVDAGVASPAINFVDKFYKIPKCNEVGYIDTLLEICSIEKIDMIIPLHEFEFYILCDNVYKFHKVGTVLMLSSKAVLDICQDKLKTYEFFIRRGVDTPRSYSKEKILNILNSINLKGKPNCDLKFPLIIKPRDGMGSTGVFKIHNLRELEFFIDYVKNPIIQEYVEGIEYTIDVLCDLEGRPISIVPRERIEVRSGEVSKSRTVKQIEIIRETYRLIEELIRDVCYDKDSNSNSYRVIGPYTIQCKITSENAIKFIEINPRFGGGVPLTFEAGVDYGKYFKLMLLGKKIEPIIGEFKEITMLRYDDAVFVK